MCTSKSCSIQREEGFASAFVIAHEMGHVIGMTHDGEISQSNECTDDPNTGSVMAPLVRSSFNQYHWSHCSNRELNDKLDKYSCLQKRRARPGPGTKNRVPHTVRGNHTIFLTRKIIRNFPCPTFTVCTTISCTAGESKLSPVRMKRLFM